MQAVLEREQALRAAQLSYTDASFHVELVQQSDVTASAPTTNGERLPALTRKVLGLHSLPCPAPIHKLGTLCWLVPSKAQLLQRGALNAH